MLAAARGVVGNAAGDAADTPGFGPTSAKNRAESAEIMKSSLWPDKRLEVKVSARNVPTSATRRSS